MKWKVFMMLCVSTFIVSFPKNIIGCGPGIDPYDYYTSFFNPDTNVSTSLRPFYYTGYNFLYTEQEPVETVDVLAEEWKNYCGSSVNVTDAKTFVTSFSLKDVNALYQLLDKKITAKLPDTVKTNAMTQFFIAKKDLEALGYIIYAKKAEPLVTGDAYAWEPIKRDSTAMAKLIKNGVQLYTAAKTALFKLKYGYQLTRLALYSGNNSAAENFYNQYVETNKTTSVLQPLALSLKAGAMYRLGLNKEAVFLFSKAFAMADVKKVSNYTSFKWAVNKKISRNEYLEVCPTDVDRANMLALFALNSVDDETETIKKIATYDSNNSVLQTLIGREINKLEEFYFAPALNKENGGKLFYYTWGSIPADSALQSAQKKVQNFLNVLTQLAALKNENAGIYNISAAYCALMIRDFKKANKFLNEANKLTLSDKLKDQLMLTKLLLSINETQIMDAAAEEKILPALKWLQQKTTDELSFNNGFSNTSIWKTFYRNIMAEALAKKYHAQADVYKEAFAIGAADKVYGGGNYVSADFLHTNTNINDVEKMYALITAKKMSAFETYLINNNAISLRDITDFAGTAYLRNYEYKKAIEWLVKSGASKKDTIYKSAFIELLGDRDERLPSEKKTTSKLLFAQEMLQAEITAKKDKPNEAKLFYKLATGMYNITYYGHAWELVQYYRSGSDGYAIPANATEFQKQYYGCYAAHDMFKKAMEASNDKNFRAKCLFMMAKCSQKTVGKPQYENFPDYKDYTNAEKLFYPAFKNNKYFPELQNEYANTVFYKEAFSRCSYLRDFVNKK